MPLIRCKAKVLLRRSVRGKGSAVSDGLPIIAEFGINVELISV